MAGVRSYPSLRMYVGADSGQAQNAYGKMINSQQMDDIIHLARTMLKQKITKNGREEL